MKQAASGWRYPPGRAEGICQIARSPRDVLPRMPGTSTPLFCSTHPAPRQLSEEMGHIQVPEQGVTFMGGPGR